MHEAVESFAIRMDNKLERRAGRYCGWDATTAAELFRHLQAEVSELCVAIVLPASSREDIADEAADVANMAMMIADNAIKGRPLPRDIGGGQFP